MMKAKLSTTHNGDVLFATRADGAVAFHGGHTFKTEDGVYAYTSDVARVVYPQDNNHLGAMREMVAAARKLSVENYGRRSARGFIPAHSESNFCAEYEIDNCDSFAIVWVSRAKFDAAIRNCAYETY